MLHELLVPAEAAGERLDVWLERQLEGCSRSLVARCIKAGRCTMQPGTVKPGWRLRGGERIAIEVPDIPDLDVVGETMPLSILYEDEALLVLDKPPGLVVHPAIGHPRGTLLNGLVAYAGGAWTPLQIHRLDADTSGVMAVAKHPTAQAVCQDAFRQRRVGKAYIAMVQGRPRSDYDEHGGAIGHSRRDFRKRCVVADDAPGAKPACTRFWVVDRQAAYTVVVARPVTGRTHQIRVHCADRHHPCLADGLYGPSDRWPVAVDQPARLTRHALHAWWLALPHPQGGVLLVSQPPPADMAALLTAWQPGPPRCAMFDAEQVPDGPQPWLPPE